MRHVIYGINLTIDGCCDHTKSTGDVEVHEYFTDLIRNADLLLYGRKTYQLMVPFWPDIAKNKSGHTKAMNEFAQTFDSVNKIVVSATIEQPEDKKTRVIRTNLKEEILKLKQEEGKSILTGGVSLPSQLIQLGLVDEFHVVVHPVIVGEGRRLLNDIDIERLPLKLVESKPFKSGCIALRYLRS
jgi:dihydrofolate reductase